MPVIRGSIRSSFFARTEKARSVFQRRLHVDAGAQGRRAGGSGGRREIDSCIFISSYDTCSHCPWPVFWLFVVCATFSHAIFGPEGELTNRGLTAFGAKHFIIRRSESRMCLLDVFDEWSSQWRELFGAMRASRARARRSVHSLPIAARTLRRTIVDLGNRMARKKNRSSSWPIACKSFYAWAISQCLGPGPKSIGNVRSLPPSN